MISPDSRADILESLRAGCSLDVAAKASRTTAAACRDLAATDEGWRADLAAAEAEGAAVRRAAEEAASAKASAPVAESPSWADAAAMLAAEREREEPAKVTATRSRAVFEEPDGDTPIADAVEMVARDAARYAPGPFGYVLRTDARCIEAGMPAMSPWWIYSVGGFYASGKTWGIFLVGRGGGKSTSLERVAATEARYTPRKVPPGQTWTMPFISVGPSDANRRINGIAAVFRADGLAIIGEEDASGTKAKNGVKISRSPRGALDLLDLRGNLIQLGSVAGTVGNISGPSTIFMLIDEAGKLLDAATNANPLTEIIASGSQTSRGRPGWKAIVCSSAWERSGAHFDLVEQGDNDTNYVARIGEPFIADAKRGFEEVAAWESARGDVEAAAIIRTHAAGLTAQSPNIPTWIANPTIGSADGLPWEGAALSTRMLVEVLPPKALGGIPRVAYWLRENGSVPMSAGAGTRAQLTAADLDLFAAENRRLFGDPFADIINERGIL
jgi:hypothetical protein